MKMADAVNTYNYALNIIKELGFSISILDHEESFDWEAKKESNTFIASDPLRLLGLILIGTEYGEEWNGMNIPNHYDLILKEHYNDNT
ncbi:hypothetical protein SAMN04487969_10523 [Paenibacillus algorifonticola]|uniref:Uncharacterized protein n=1 Tax=Paenibacillus algorifonticola TaxID=684063 RepID=A0A1I2CE42_9BACL|nr:hypothetical protein [Paenibacillus algorifonticola]SFE66544.1 hypothetical protein SAMN04487969_10523 [Paenibacillus algorifonticola]